MEGWLSMSSYFIGVAVENFIDISFCLQWRNIMSWAAYFTAWCSREHRCTSYINTLGCYTLGLILLWIMPCSLKIDLIRIALWYEYCLCIDKLWWWCDIFWQAMEVQLNSAPKGNGPLAEIEYWKERHANLSALDEQLNRPKVQEIVKVTTQPET